MAIVQKRLKIIFNISVIKKSVFRSINLNTLYHVTVCNNLRANEYSQFSLYENSLYGILLRRTCLTRLTFIGK